MALLGNLEMLIAQSPNHKLLHEGLHFLKTVNIDEVFAKTSLGNNITIEIVERKLFAIFQTYDSKTIDQLKFESHTKYIDIQYMHSGEEFIGVCGTEQILEAGEYNAEKDIAFPKVNKYSNLLMTTGNAAILFPADLHAPSMNSGKVQRIQKIVIKVAV